MTVRDRRRKRGVSSFWRRLALAVIAVGFVAISVLAYLLLDQHRHINLTTADLNQCRLSSRSCAEKTGDFDRTQARLKKADQIFKFYNTDTWIQNRFRIKREKGQWVTLGTCGASYCYEVHLLELNTLVTPNVATVGLKDVTMDDSLPNSSEEVEKGKKGVRTIEFDLPVQPGCYIQVDTSTSRFMFAFEDETHEAVYLSVGIHPSPAMERIGTFYCPEKKSG